MGLTSKDDHIGGQGVNIGAGANVHSMYYLMETEWCDSLTGCRNSGPFPLPLLGLLIPLLLSSIWPGCVYPHSGQSGCISHALQCLQSLPHPFLPQNMAHYSNITKERLYHLFALQLGTLLYWRCLEDRVFKMANEWRNEWYDFADYII